MTGAQVFVVVWGVLAIGMGVLFARAPQRVFDALVTMSPGWYYRWLVGNRGWVIWLYRAGGYLFICLGVLVPTLAIIGGLK